MVTPKKNPPPKPPVTRSKTKNQPTPTPVAATDLEADVTDVKSKNTYSVTF